MPKAPEFFLPWSEGFDVEKAYADLAARVHLSIPPMNRRIYSITFKHDGQLWIATVGEQMHGHTIANPRDRAKKRRIEKPLHDAATVVAIFASEPYFVWTDSGHRSGATGS